MTKKNEIEKIMVIIPKRSRDSKKSFGENKEVDNKISDLNRRLYYLKKIWSRDITREEIV